MRVKVVVGDIAQVKASTLVTVINSGGVWRGGIYRTILMSSGDMFHSQATASQPLGDGQIISVPATNKHKGQFDSVTFVVDDLRQSVSSLVRRALIEVEERGHTIVSFPAIRARALAGAYEPRTQALTELAETIGNFANDGHPSSIEEIIIVAHNSDDARFLRKALASVLV